MKLKAMAAIALTFAALDPEYQAMHAEQAPKLKRPNIDYDSLKAEYELIKQKKSSLSRAKRDYIVKEYGAYLEALAEKDATPKD